MKYLKIVILLIFYSSVIGQEASLEEAKRLIHSDQFQKAKEVLNTCDEDDCQYLLADVYYRAGEFLSAKPILDSLLNNESYAIASHRLLSKIYESEGNVPKAVSHYSTLAKSDTTNAIYQRKLGNLYHKSGYTLESLASYNKALKLNPKDIITISALSEMLFTINKIEEADSIINLGHQLDSTNINVQLIRSRIAYKQKKYQDVTEILRGIRGRIDLDDYSSKILGFSFVKIDSFERAIFTLHKVLLNDPEAESVLYFLGVAYENLDQPVIAATFYDSALNAGISKQTSLYHRKIADLAEDKKDWPTAINHYKKSLDYEKNPEVYFLLAMATDNYYKDKSTSVRYYKKYIESNHDNPQWRKYAKERRNYLKEIAFLKKN